MMMTNPLHTGRQKEEKVGTDIEQGGILTNT